MKFEDIKFQERSGAGKSGLGLYLAGGYWVARKYFEIAWKHAHVNAPGLDWNVPQTAETLCGKAIWQDRRCGERIALGRCIKYFVDNGILSLRVANLGKEGKRKYLRA